MNKQFYFIKDGIRYPTGTILHFIGCDRQGHSIVENMTFLYVNPNIQWYFLYKESDGKTWIYDTNQFNKKLINIPGMMHRTIRTPTKKYRKDSEIEELFLGWMWYIVWMAFATITTSAFAGWILGTAIFFIWRNKIKEEKGWYYEW